MPTPELTETRRNALIDVAKGYLLDGPELAAAAWLCMKGLIEPATSHRTNDRVAKRAFVLTAAGRDAAPPWAVMGHSALSQWEASEKGYIVQGPENSDEAGERPHGRRGWVLHGIPATAGWRYIDLSIMPHRPAKPSLEGGEG